DMGSLLSHRACTSRASDAAAVVDVHRLQRHLPRAGEAIHEEAEAAEEAGGEALGGGLHLHMRVLVEPAARLDVDLLVRRELLLEDVAVAVQPEHAVALARV